MSEAILTYQLCKDMPLGAVVADAEGYWQRNGRHYVKTSDNTWAVFFSKPTADDIAEAVAVRRNNLSPCPSGYMANIYLAERVVDIPGFEEVWADLGSLSILGANTPGSKE